MKDFCFFSSFLFQFIFVPFSYFCLDSFCESQENLSDTMNQCIFFTLVFLKVTWRQKNFCSKSNSRHGPLDRASLEWLTRGLEKKFRGQPTEIFQKNVEISDMGFRVLPVFGRTPFQSHLTRHTSNFWRQKSSAGFNRLVGRK